MTDHDFNILEGVYEDWDKVAADEGFFESDLWVNKISSLAQSHLESYQASDITASVQNFYGKKIRSRFLNIKELLAATKRLGFRLIYKSRYLKETRGIMGPLPMENFEKEYRLAHASQILFRWEGEK